MAEAVTGAANDRTGAPARGWPRAAGLLGVVLAVSVTRPSVLLAVLVLPLLLMRGRPGLPALLLAALALATVAAGPFDGLWFVERAWALTVAGAFVALTLRVPGWRLSVRAMVAVLGAMALAAGLLAARSGGWAALDWYVADGVRGGVGTTLDALAALRGGEPMAPAFVSAMYEMAETRVAVFPAMMAIASMAAVGVAWWVAQRLTGGGDQALAPVAAFRFNDQLVWVLIGGLLLVVTRWGDALTRIGSNVVVFMGALYALRGSGVVMFLSGRLPLLVYALAGVAFVALPSFVLGVAVLIGIADTWLDLRGRAGRSVA